MQDKTKTILPLVVAVVLGIVSVVIINRYITSKTTVPEVKKVKVIIAAKPIVSSQIISMDQLGVKEVPENATSDVNIIVPYSGTPERTYEEID
ncbi:MAG TPA: hypothetical protein P5239_06805, partial [Victivallales bacterium]|nr:hypothetical protein [Victivallales bacterium]